MSATKGKSFIIVAVLLGVGAAVVGYFGLTSMASQATAHNNANFRNVVVTATDLTFGVKFDRTMLRVVRYPKESVPEGAFSTIDSVLGQTTKVFMSAREPVTAIKMSSRGGGLSMLVRPNMRAASLEVNQVSGVSGFVLQNCEVLASGQKTQQQDNKPITVQSVTILVDPDGAETLALAMHEGKIHLVLRNPEDQNVVQVASLSTQEMLGHRAEPVAKASAGPRRPTPASPMAANRPGPSPKVRMIRSASVTETPAVADSTN